MKTRSSPYAILLLVVPLLAILAVCLWRLRPAHGAEPPPERPQPSPFPAKKTDGGRLLLTEIHPQEGCQVQVRDSGALLVLVCDHPGWAWLRLGRGLWPKAEQTILSESPPPWWSRHSGVIAWALSLGAGLYLGRRWGRRGGAVPARVEVAEPAGQAELREELGLARAALAAEQAARAQAEEALVTHRQHFTDDLLRHIHQKAALEREIAGLHRELAERQVPDHAPPTGYLGEVR